MRTFPISEAGGLPAVHFRLEGRSDGVPVFHDIGCMFRLEIEGATWKTSVKTRLVSQNIMA